MKNGGLGPAPRKMFQITPSRTSKNALLQNSKDFNTTKDKAKPSNAAKPMIEAKLSLPNTLKKRHFSPSDIWHGLHGMHSKGTMPYFLKGLPSPQAETLRHSYNIYVVTEKS